MKKIIWSQHGRRLVSPSKAQGIMIGHPLARVIGYKLSLVSITNKLNNK